MSRLKNFSRNLFTSYLQLGVNVVYSLVSIPLILHWLPRAEFGMWALLVQMMGYLGLVDLGMTSAVARLLVDHKDDRTNGNYGSLLQTAVLVSLAQAILVLTLALAGAPLFASLLNIPQEHTAQFVVLLRLQGAITAFNFALRPLNMMLYSHQRLDIQAYNDTTSLMISLGLLALMLSNGAGIYAFIYANATTALLGAGYLFWNCRRLDLLPRPGEWGRATGKMFAEVFFYGNKIFLFNLGCQLQSASQTIVVSRALGLEAAAVWSVGTKMFNLMFPLMTRLYGSALPGIFEMVARGEMERLKTRFQSIVVLTASLGAFLGGSFLLCNSLFVGCWTAGKIHWPVLNDVLLAGWLLLLALQTTHCTFVTVIKKFEALSYVFLGEGAAFILLTVTLGKYGGIAGMIGCSILCTLLFSYQYGIRRSARYFHCRYREIALGWVRPSLKLALAYGGLALGVWFGTLPLPPVWRLAVHATVAGTAGLLLFFRMGLPAEVRGEISHRLPAGGAGWFRIFAGGPAKN
jgi:O-antigen/teichoic acid export membrane protein